MGLITGLLGAGLSMYGNYKANQMRDSAPQALSPSDIRGQFEDTEQSIGQMQGGYNTMMDSGSRMMGYGTEMMGMGRQMMDPQSAYNRQQYDMMRNQGAGQMALQSLLNRRQNAQMGQSSGIGAAQQRNLQQQTASSLSGQYANQLLQNRQMGMAQFGQGFGQYGSGVGVHGQAQGIIGNIAQMRMGMDENAAQAGIAQRKFEQDTAFNKAQGMQDMYSGIGSGLISWGA